MSNTFTAVIPRLLAQGVVALRQNAITPRVVNTNFSTQSAQKGSTIDVPIASSITAVAVSPANTPPATTDITPSYAQVSLDQWYEAPFYLTDKETNEVMEGYVPLQAAEAVKALVNQVDQNILSLYKKFYGYQGTAGTAPFGAGVLIADATGARAILNTQLAPLQDRHVILDPAAEANLFGIEAFTNGTYTGDVQAILAGRMNQRLGMSWWMNQNVPYHTTTTQAGAVTANGVNALGATSISLAKAAGTNMAALEGDIFTIAGDSQTYVITAAVTITQGANTTVTIAPGLKKATAGSEAVTFKASHRANLAWHRDAIAFASRTLDSGGPANPNSMTVADPLSGLTLRLEVTREHKRWRWSYDMLWGAVVVRRELGMRIAG